MDCFHSESFFVNQVGVSQNSILKNDEVQFTIIIVHQIGFLIIFINIVT